MLNSVVSPDTIRATDILMFGEMLFKVQKFQLLKCDDFLNDEYKGIDMSSGISRVFNLCTGC